VEPKFWNFEKLEDICRHNFYSNSNCDAVGVFSLRIGCEIFQRISIVSYDFRVKLVLAQIESIWQAHLQGTTKDPSQQNLVYIDTDDDIKANSMATVMWTKIMDYVWTSMIRPQQFYKRFFTASMLL
jgi:hypothetical protein